MIQEQDGGSGTHGRDNSDGILAALVGRDAKTGQTHLKLPIPSEDTLNQIAGALDALAKAFGRGH